MSSLVESARRFAEKSHGDQKRKYTGEPYITHPVAVSVILRDFGFDEYVQAAAMLHDVVEDCGVTLEEIRDLFGTKVALLVEEVTDVSRPEDGNRALRRAKDLDHLAKASPHGQSLKLADLIHNTVSIVEYDHDFARIYLKEKEDIIAVLRSGKLELRVIARDQILMARRALGMLDSLASTATTGA